MASKRSAERLAVARGANGGAAMAFEFGMFHEFQRPAGMSRGGGFRRSRSSRSMPPSAGVSMRCGWPRSTSRPERSVCVGAADPRQRDRRAHQAHEDRHRRPGLAAVPSAAARRGGRHGRSDQPRPADLRGRAQRLPAHLRGLWRALWREPRALCRDARDPEEGVDRGAVLLPGQVLQLRQRQG